MIAHFRAMKWSLCMHKKSSLIFSLLPTFFGCNWYAHPIFLKLFLREEKKWQTKCFKFWIRAKIMGANSRRKLLLLLAGSYSRRKRIVERKFWVHPAIAKRDQFGQYKNLYAELEKYPDRYFKHMWMSKEKFESLLEKVAPSLESDAYCPFRRKISAKEKLIVTLR